MLKLYSIIYYIEQRSGYRVIATLATLLVSIAFGFFAFGRRCN